MSDTPDYILRQPDGYVLYFGVPGGDSSLLPVGSQFDVIQTVDWKKIRWLITESIEKYGKHKGELSRFYRVVRQRLMDADEAAVWQEYIERWEAENE